MPTLGQRGDRLDLLIRQGATLGPFLVTLQPEDLVNSTLQDLTGALVRGTVLKDYDSLVAYPLDTNIVDAAGRKFTMGMSAAMTATIPYHGDIFDPANQYVWDLEVEFPDGFILPVFWGIGQIAPEATK